MARDKNLTIVPGKGEYWLAAPGTAFPTDPDDPAASGYEEVGHTSRDAPMQVSRDGGESTPKGSWQDPNMRTDVSPVTYKVAFSLLQHDKKGLKLYHGANSLETARGIKPPKKPQPTEATLFMRIIDGGRAQYRHYDRTEILGADSEEFDVENLAGLPVAATILGAEDSDYLGEITVPAGMGANEIQVVTITGAPTGGTFTLTFDGQTTGTIVYNATAAAVQTALEALSNIATGDVAVTGSTGGPWTVEFQGTYAGVDVPQMTASSTGLTGGTTPTVTVTTQTQGGS